MSNQVAIKEVLNATTYDFVTGLPLNYFDYAELTEIQNKSSRLTLTGGQGNYSLISLDHSKTSSLKIRLPLVDTSFLATLMGDTVSVGAQPILVREVVYYGSGTTVTLANTPNSVAPVAYYLGSGIGSANSRDNGLPVTKVASAPTVAQFSITGSTITFAVGDIGKYFVFYYSYNAPSSTTKFSMKANKFIQPVKFVGTGLVVDQVSGAQRASVITIYNGKFDANFNLTMSSTGATVLDLTLDMFAVQVGTDYVYYDVVFLT